jgi:hypothetical protein
MAAKSKSDATEALKQLTYLAAQDPPGHRPGHCRRPPRPPGPVRDRDRMGHPAHRRPPRRPTAPRARPAAPLRADRHRRGRLPALRARRREPVLPTRLIPLRTRLPDPDLQPAVQRLGRHLRRPSRRRSHDQPRRPPRRRPHPERRQLRTTQPRHRHPAHHQKPSSCRLEPDKPVAPFSTVGSASHSSVVDTPSPRFPTRPGRRHLFQ